jgi:hypothetical protein
VTTLVGNRPCARERTDPTHLGLEAAFDGSSRRHLKRTGVGPGWRCWEVGAGAGSMARWLATKVGPAGSVLATDVDTTGMSWAPPPNVRVQRHDVATEPLPGTGYRCIHARLLLGELSDRAEILERLASALDPGGWLVVEDLALVLPPLPEPATVDERLVHKVRSGFTELLRGLRGDGAWAGSLPGRLRRLGLVDVGASTHAAVVRGGSAASAIERSHLGQVGEQLVAFGLGTKEEVDRCLQLLGDPGFRFTMPPLVSAWGRRLGAD